MTQLNTDKPGLGRCKVCGSPLDASGRADGPRNPDGSQWMVLHIFCPNGCKAKRP